jgi:hypothetical protein
MEMPMSKTESTFVGVSITVGMLNKGKEGIYVSTNISYFLYHHHNHHTQTLRRYKDQHSIVSQNSLYHQHLNKTKTPFSNNNITINMQTQAIMGRGGYNRISSLALGRGGYNRDVKTSGISRPSNPSSLTVRSARTTDDGRGGYN